MKTLSHYEKVLLGKVDNKPIYLSPPSWDCGWYWGFGYLGNNDCHYHVDGLKKIETYNSEKQVWQYEFVNLYDGFKKHFGASFIIKRDKDIWTLAELFETFYALTKTAEVLGHGGAHMTTNPCQKIIINKAETDRINNVVLPAVFEEIYKILKRNKDCDKTFQKLVELSLDGDTNKVVDFMLANQIHTDDIKNIKGLVPDDKNAIHTLYWRRHHAKNKKENEKTT